MKNTEVEMDITDINAKGFGVGRINDFVMLVNEGLPDDRLAIKVVKAKKHYGYGKIVNVLKPSLHRIQSRCPISNLCGGCQWQHCDYSAQLDFKRRIVTNAFNRIGGIENPPVMEVIGMETPWSYRNKGLFPVVPSDGPDGFAIGMYQARSHRIVEFEECIIQHPAHIKLIKTLREYMRRHNVSAYNEISHSGLIRSIMVRVSFSTKEVMAVIAVNGDSLPGELDLAANLASAGATTVIINRHISRSERVNVNEADFRTICGPGYIKECIGDIWYQLSAPSFFQVNPIQTKILYDTALNQAGLDGTQPVIDAHCGVGTVALYAAKHAKHVIGVDIVPSAISDAQKNAALNNIENARFICGSAEAVIPDLLAAGEKPQAVFLDPPRRGCDNALLDALITSRIEKIVYISCDPATLARDAKRLIEGGYKLEIIQPVDMFPMTSKVEVSCLFVTG